MFDFFHLVPLCALGALGFALFLVFRILQAEQGTDKMKEIAAAVMEGSRAYLKRQYMAVGSFFAVVFIILFFFICKPQNGFNSFF